MQRRPTAFPMPMLNRRRLLGSGLAVAALQIDNDVPDKVVETFKADADLLWAVKVDFSEAAR